MMKSKATLLTCATSLFFLTACGGGAAIKNAEVPEAKPVSQPVMAKPSPDQTKAPDLNEAQLKATLVGHTQKGSNDKWTNTYHPSGVLKGTWDGKNQTGTYTIKGNVLCRQWNGKQDTSCWTIQKREKDYYATLKSGGSVSYAFAMGAMTQKQAPAVNTAQQASSLNEAQLKATFVGHTQTGTGPKGNKWTVTSYPNGVMKGTSLSTTGVNYSDTGTYSIKGNLLCRLWSEWSKDGVTSCFTIQKREKDYYATKKSGNTESYAFTMGAKAQTQQTALTDAQIKSLITGKTMVGDNGTDKINEDGTFDSIYKGKASKGKYSIANGLYCTGNSTNRCRSITKTAKGYYAKSVSGGGDSFSFTVR